MLSIRTIKNLVNLAYNKRGGAGVIIIIAIALIAIAVIAAFTIITGMSINSASKTHPFWEIE